MEPEKKLFSDIVAERAIQLIAEGLAAKVADRVVEALASSGFERAFAEKLIQRLREELGIKEE